MPANGSLVIRTDKAKIIVAAGCKALVTVKNGSVAVFNLFDTRRGQVTMMAAGRSFDVALGQQALLTTSGGSFTKTNPTPEVAVRSAMQQHALGGDAQLFIADFSIPSALMNHAALHSLLRSENVAHKRQVAQIIKAASILSIVGSTKYGAYRTNN
jgi:hypothetical protein